MATFAYRLRQLRKEKRITQEKLAERFFITKSAVSKYETGINTPENKLLQDMADFFEVSVDYLLGRTDSKTDKIESISASKAAEILGAFAERGIAPDEIDLNDFQKILDMYLLWTKSDNKS